MSEYHVNIPGTRLAEEVNADRVEIHPSGALAFYEDGDYDESALLVAYAPHAWTVVTGQ